MNWTVFLLWIVFCAMNCVFYCVFSCYELRFVFFFYHVFLLWLVCSAMNLDFYCVVFLLCIVLFIVFFCYELCFFGVSFFVMICCLAHQKSTKKHKKAHKSIRKSWVLVPWKKCKNGPPDLDSLWPSGPANVSHPFLLPTSFPRDSLRSESPCFRGHCILKNSDLFRTPQQVLGHPNTYIQWLDHLIALYLRIAGMIRSMLYTQDW